MKPGCWLIAVATILFIIIGGRLVINHRTHQFQVLSETVAQQINQQPINPSSLEYHIYEPPFNFSLDNPQQFKILSEAPELQIELYRQRNKSTVSKVFKFSLATIIFGIPFLFCAFMFFAACLGLITSFFAILFGNFSEVWMFLNTLLLGLVTGVFAALFFAFIGGSFVPPSFKEIRASRELLADVSQSGTESISSSTIQYFNLFRCSDTVSYGGSSPDTFELDVVTNQKLDKGKYRHAVCGSPYANYQGNKGINLYDSESSDRVIWLGLALADFYETEFRVTHETDKN